MCVYTCTYMYLYNKRHVYTALCDVALVLTGGMVDIYNCLTIHGLVCAKDLPSSVLEIGAFWQSTAYSINGLTFSLDDIEHGVLRGEARRVCVWRGEL